MSVYRIEVIFLLKLTRTQAFVRSFAAWVLEKFVGDKIFARVFRVAHEKRMSEYMKYCDARNAYNKMFYAEVSGLLTLMEVHTS